MRRARTSACIVMLMAALAPGLGACDRDDAGQAGASDHGRETAAHAPAPTNRVDIPGTVRQNLGITFARVERRNVERTLRVPGRFELLPTARREYRTPLPGRVELLATQYQRVEPGTPLYRVESAEWRELHERIAAVTARVESMDPVRDAHRVHEKSLEEKVSLWQARLKQLEEIRAAGGGSAAAFTEAQATLNATQAELADVMEKDAELLADQRGAEAELRGLQARHDILVAGAGCPRSPDAEEEDLHGVYEACAVVPGVVESIAVTPGGLADSNGLVLSVIQPEAIRFRARGLQSDLGRLKEGLPVRIAPPQGAGASSGETISGTLRIGLAADPDERTVDLVVEPASGELPSWARAGVSAQMEITLEGGREELATPLAAVVRDGATAVIFRRDPTNPDRAIRMEADLGASDGQWIVIQSGVKEGDEIVVGGNYQLMLATSGSAPKGGHFHSDGTFHEGDE